MRRARKFWVVSAIVGAMLALGSAAVGEPAPKAPPKSAAPEGRAPTEGVLELEADEMDLDLDGKSAELHGHVQLEKSGMSLRCDHMSVRYDEVPIVTWAKGTGRVVLEVRGVRAEAPEVVIDVQRNLVTLGGGVRVARKEGWLTAEQATVNLATGHVKLKQVKGVVAMPSKQKPGSRRSKAKQKTPKRQ